MSGARFTTPKAVNKKLALAAAAIVVLGLVAAFLMRRVQTPAIDPTFDPLRKNPRFQRLVAGAG